MINVDNLSQKKLKRTLMYLINEEREDSEEEETDFVIELKKLRNKILKTVTFRRVQCN